MEKTKEKMNEKNIQKLFYKTNPSGGISLIVLVITIIIIIILAAAVVVSIVNNNPMSEASEARIKSDVSNMQSIFTNAVGKVMAENQDTITIDAGALNTVTSGDKSAVGNAVYKFADGTSGEIIFDTLEKDGLKYYTGRRLPLYKQKTTWYVDEDGIISLEVGNKKYGDGKIIKNIKIVTEVIPSEEYIKKSATVKIEVSSEDEIESIKFGGNDISVPERKDEKYEVEIEVTENGEYEIEATGKGGGKNTAKVEVNVIDELNEEIDIRSTVTFVDSFLKTKANIKLEIIYSGEIESIKINEENQTVPSKVSGKYTLNKQVTENGEYKVEVRAKDGTQNKKIVKVSGIEKLSENIRIDATVTTTSDYVSADIYLTITYSGEVSSIKIEGESQTVPSKANGKYTLSKKVTENGEYKVEVKSKDGLTNKITVKVTELTEDMDIWNRADMESFRNKVNSGRTFEGRNVRVRAHIDLQGGDSNLWTPIGFNSADVWSKPFKGTFEGNNYNITNLYINSTADCQGLFGFVDNGTINNTRVSGVTAGSGNSLTNTIKGGNYVGAIVGAMNGIISNCRCAVKVEGAGSSIGGIAGHLNGTINNCTNAHGVSGINNVGGIIGYHKGIIQDCTDTAGATGSNYIGGIVGYKESGSTARCTNNLGITGTNKVGGIIGYNAGTITDCKNTIGLYMGSTLVRQNIINGSNDHTGGIAGYSTGNITRCSNAATVQGTNMYAGGITGESTSTGSITLCYNTGAISINTWYVGGITSANHGGINSCYNKGSVTCNSYYQPYNASWSGGIAAGGTGNIDYCYNTGTIYAYSRCVSGIYAGGGDTSQYINHAYNAGSYSQTKSGYIGPIIGQNKGGCSVLNSWQANDLINWDKDTINENLGPNFKKDESNINNGYPILSWQ